MFNSLAKGMSLNIYLVDCRCERVEKTGILKFSLRFFDSASSFIIIILVVPMLNKLFQEQKEHNQIAETKRAI